MQEDFESSFQPGFTQFGNFGPQLGHFGPAQTNGRTVWGAPAETWWSLWPKWLAIVANKQTDVQSLNYYWWLNDLSSERQTEKGITEPCSLFQSASNSFCFQINIYALFIMYLFLRGRCCELLFSVKLGA